MTASASVAEDAVEPPLGRGEARDELRVGQGERGPAGEELREGELVRAVAAARGADADAERAQRLVADVERQRHRRAQAGALDLLIERSGLRSTMALPLDSSAGGRDPRRRRRRLLGPPLDGTGSKLKSAGPRSPWPTPGESQRLTATQRRLDGILGTLAEAVTTAHDSQGKVVFANPAAAQLVGVRGWNEVLDAEPSELFGIFNMHNASRPATSSRRSCRARA